MTATLPEQLRTFHITGHGLVDAVPALNLEAIANGRAIPAEEDCTAVALATTALLQVRGPIRAQFTEQLRRTAERIDDLLALDDSHAAGAVPANTLGAFASQYLNVANLTAALSRRANPVQRMAPERVARCRQALQTLRDALALDPPPIHIFESCAEALSFARQQLAAVEPTLIALRIARLELEDAYDPIVHDPILQRFRWEAADPDELAALPPVIALLTAAPLDSLSQLLRSGCPIQVIVTQPALTAEDLANPPIDLARIAIAHRHAFVLQGALARPDHLRESLARMARFTGPALAVIATPSAGGWREAVILTLAKAWALYTYNPAASPSLQLLPIEPNTWTAAHAAALNPTLNNHFRLLPEPSEEAVELDIYLDQLPLAIPYITAKDNQRIALSRDLADFCRDRRQAYNQLDQSLPAPTAELQEQAMRQGAELTLARVLALLAKEGGKP